MRVHNCLAASGTILLVLLSAGCRKKVELTFTNLTGQARSLRVSVPGEGTTELGTLVPNGGRTRHEVNIAKDLLPAWVGFEAGDQSGRIPVTDKSPKKLWIDIKPGAARARDENTEIEEKTHIEIHDQPIRQETVVE